MREGLYGILSESFSALGCRAGTLRISWCLSDRNGVINGRRRFFVLRVSSLSEALLDRKKLIKRVSLVFYALITHFAEY